MDVLPTFFSLACVLFEVYSVWLGLSIDDPDSFSALAPFHQNLSGIYSWIKTFLQTCMDFWRYKKTQELFQPLFSQKPADRPKMRDVVSDMVIFLDPNDLFCNACFLDMVPRSSTSPPPTTEGRSTGSRPQPEIHRVGRFREHRPFHLPFWTTSVLWQTLAAASTRPSTHTSCVPCGRYRCHNQVAAPSSRRPGPWPRERLEKDFARTR